MGTGVGAGTVPHGYSRRGTHGIMVSAQAGPCDLHTFADLAMEASSLSRSSWDRLEHTGEPLSHGQVVNPDAMTQSDAHRLGPTTWKPPVDDTAPVAVADVGTARCREDAVLLWRAWGVALSRRRR